MKLLNTTMLVLSSLVFASCASILNGRYQKITVNTESKQATVYVDDELAGKGDHVTASMERNQRVKEVRIEEKGYKPEHRVHFQSKKSPLYIMSWVPFGITFVAPLADFGPKSYNYEQEMAIPSRTKIAYREDDQKYLYLRATSFDLGEDDLAIKIYSHRRYVKNKNSIKTEYNKENIQLDNSVFTMQLNDLLKEYGYIDTVRSVLKDKTNTMYISAEVKKVTFNGVRPFKANQSFSHYLVAETSIDWQILDVYNVPKYSTTKTAKSGEFSASAYEEDGYTRAAIKDALTQSLIDFLNEEEVQKLLKKESFVDVSLPELSLSNPISNTNNLEEAQQATVTISHADGHGSGFFVNNEGYIITNYHVVAGKTDDLEVITNDGEHLTADFVRANEYIDLALLKVNVKPKHAFSLTAEKNYYSGDEVFAIGTPTSLELGQTISRGIISGIRKQDRYETIQTDVSVNPGNSGGALVNRKGELIGVVNSKVIGNGIEGISFCIPAKDILGMLSISLSKKVSMK